MDEYLLKVVVVGSMAVGKTALLLRYIDDEFTGQHITTIGVDFKIKMIERPTCHARLQLWDTAGQDRFRTIVSSFYRGAEGLIVVFDLTDVTSFEKVPYWIQEARTHSHTDCQMLLVGNKSDLTSRRAVEQKTAQALADKLGIKYIETSAKTAQNVHAAFDAMADVILENKRTMGYPPLLRDGSAFSLDTVQSKEVSESSCYGIPSCYS